MVCKKTPGPHTFFFFFFGAQSRRVVLKLVEPAIPGFSVPFSAATVPSKSLPAPFAEAPPVATAEVALAEPAVKKRKKGGIKA